MQAWGSSSKLEALDIPLPESMLAKATDLRIENAFSLSATLSSKKLGYSMSLQLMFESSDIKFYCTESWAEDKTMEVGAPAPKRRKVNKAPETSAPSTERRREPAGDGGVSAVPPR